MQFNNHSSSFDIVSDARYWCGADSVDYPTADLTRNANLAMDRIVALIMASDQKWEWDDANNTDLPLAVTDLVASQSDYSLAVTHLKVLRVRIKNSAGEWVSLDPVDRRDLTDSELTADAGEVKKYDKIGNSIFLYPAPNYSSTDGFEVQFQRGASYFTTSDTTKTPGFASQFHRLVSLHAAKDFCALNGLDKRLNIILKEIATMESNLVDFYSERNRDEEQSFKTRREDYGSDSLGEGTIRQAYPKRFF